MDKQELEKQFAALGIDSSAYSLSGGLPNERYVLSQESDGCSVYYSERGQRSEERWFSSESEACAYLLSLLMPLRP